MNTFLRISTAALLAISTIGAVGTAANAAACREAHGRFVHCATAHRAAGHRANALHAATPARPATVQAARNTAAATKAVRPAAGAAR